MTGRHSTPIVLGFALCFLWLGTSAFSQGDAPHRRHGDRTKGSSLSERSLDNLVAFTRLLGYVRYFHPSNQSATTDWDSFAIDAIPVVESAADADDLAQKLTGLFAPIAPSVRVFLTGMVPTDEPVMVPPGADATLRITRWDHFGVGFDGLHAVLVRYYQRSPYYQSNRVYTSASNASVPPDFADPRLPFSAVLGGGVSCRVPLAVFADADGTYPRPIFPHPNQGVSDPLDFSLQDRATRLAAVAITWNVFQHFFPYFDVTGTDWLAVLRPAFEAAAEDVDPLAFRNSMRRMLAPLQDGHANAWLAEEDTLYLPPLVLDWIEEQLVVTHVLNDELDSIHPGDVVLAIDDQPTLDALRATEELISAATLQWKRFRSVREVVAGPQDTSIHLAIQPYAGSSFPSSDSINAATLLCYIHRVKRLSQNAKGGVILSAVKDLIGPVALLWRFRNKFGMTRWFEGFSPCKRWCLGATLKHCCGFLRLISKFYRQQIPSSHKRTHAAAGQTLGNQLGRKASAPSTIAP